MHVIDNFPGSSRIIQILARQREIDEIGDVLPPQFRIHLDDFTMMVGPPAWRAYLSFMWECGRIEQPRGTLGEVIVNPDGTVTVTGHWVGQRRGRELRSELVSIRYREERGQVVEIWSHVDNYLFFFPILRSRLGQLALIVYQNLWRRLCYERRRR